MRLRRRPPKDLKNPDCPFCCDFFEQQTLTGKCARCDNTAVAVIAHATAGWRRSSQVCAECFEQHNAWFYGKRTLWTEPADNGWLFTGRGVE